LLLTTPVLAADDVKHGDIDSPIIKHDLNGMTDRQINDYFSECISNGLIFLYRGGYTGWYLVDKEDRGFLEKFKWVGLGCTGGVPQGYKFNGLMLNYVKQRELITQNE